MINRHTEEVYKTILKHPQSQAWDNWLGRHLALKDVLDGNICSQSSLTFANAKDCIRWWQQVGLRRGQLQNRCQLELVVEFGGENATSVVKIGCL